MAFLLHAKDLKGVAKSRRRGPLRFMLALTRKAFVLAVVGGAAVMASRTVRGKALVDTLDARVKAVKARLARRRGAVLDGVDGGIDGAACADDTGLVLIDGGL